MEPLPEFLFLALYDILEDFCSKSKGDGVGHVDEDCVAYLCLDSFIRKVIQPLVDVLFYDPEIFTVNI